MTQPSFVAFPRSRSKGCKTAMLFCLPPMGSILRSCATASQATPHPSPLISYTQDEVPDALIFPPFPFSDSHLLEDPASFAPFSTILGLIDLSLFPFYSLIGKMLSSPSPECRPLGHSSCLSPISTAGPSNILFHLILQRSCCSSPHPSGLIAAYFLADSDCIPQRSEMIFLYPRTALRSPAFSGFQDGIDPLLLRSIATVHFFSL